MVAAWVARPNVAVAAVGPTTASNTMLRTRAVSAALKGLMQLPPVVRWDHSDHENHPDYDKAILPSALAQNMPHARHFVVHAREQPHIDRIRHKRSKFNVLENCTGSQR